MVKAVILDLNGVFLESEYLSKRMNARYGVPVEAFVAALKEVMAVARGPGCEDSFVLWKPHLVKLGLEIAREEFFDFWFSGEKPVPEVLEYVRQLRSRGIKVLILSNNFKERTEYYRTHFPEIFENVDKVYFSWETGFVKPDPKAYQNILDEHSLKPEEVIYFDDSEENIEVAKSLGLHAYRYQGLQAAKDSLQNLNP